MILNMILGVAIAVAIICIIAWLEVEYAYNGAFSDLEREEELYGKL